MLIYRWCFDHCLPWFVVHICSTVARLAFLCIFVSFCIKRLSLHFVCFAFLSKLGILFVSIAAWRCAVAEWYAAGLAIMRSWVQILPMAAVYQRQFSMPSIRGRLMSTSEIWGVNGHTTRCTSPVSVVLRLRLVSSWALWNGDRRRPMGLKARERTLLF